MKSRRVDVSVDAMLEGLRRLQQEKIEDDNEEVVKSGICKKRKVCDHNKRTDYLTKTTTRRISVESLIN